MPIIDASLILQTRWGIGSGVGLFIVAGFSHQIITGLINWMPDVSGLAVGVIPEWIQIASEGYLGGIWEGGSLSFFSIT